MASQKHWDLRSMIYAAVCLTLCMVLPLFTANIPAIGTQFSPMHFPVLLCGFISGPFWGCIVGFCAPLLRNFLFGVPNLYPQALRMMFELFAYGAFAGLFYRYLPKKPWGIYASLISAQFFGRLAWGIAQFFLSTFDHSMPFYLEMVITQTVANSLYGLAIQLVFIPPIVLAMQRARLIVKH